MSGFKVPGVTLNDPGTWPSSPCRIVGAGGVAVRFHGLSKRELFAAMAMQGLSASDAFAERTVELVADLAVKQADALLAELAKPQEGSAS